MIGACGLGTHTFRTGCEDAHGLPARALIATSGGHSAGKVAHVASREPSVQEQIETITLRVRALNEQLQALIAELTPARPPALQVLRGGRDA